MTMTNNDQQPLRYFQLALVPSYDHGSSTLIITWPIQTMAEAGGSAAQVSWIRCLISLRHSRWTTLYFTGREVGDCRAMAR